MLKWIFCVLLSVSAPAWAHKGHESLPAEAAPQGLSIYQIESTWKDPSGSSIAFQDLAGTPRLVTMLYTRCQTACPLIVDDIKGILSALSETERKKVRVAVFSVDSEKETPETLRDFAKKRKLDANWRLFTSGPSEVATLAAALGFRYKRQDDGEYVHSNVIYFVNARGEIVAQKEGLKTPRTSFVKKIKANL